MVIYCILFLKLRIFLKRPHVRVKLHLRQDVGDTIILSVFVLPENIVMYCKITIKRVRTVRYANSVIWHLLLKNYEPIRTC